jgi:hypothetical protein
MENEANKSDYQRTLNFWDAFERVQEETFLF